MPFIFSEWLCERVSYLLGRWAFLNILGHAGRLTILVAVIFYFAEFGSRRKAKHYQAWQVINAAQGQPGSGGRIDALQDLNKDKVSLAGVDISGANLRGIDLKNANLYEANLSGAHLYEANLSGAFLYEVNLSGAFLSKANLSEANLSLANLSEANLSEVDLQNTNFSGADLHNANLSEADLHNSDLSEADLHNANLSGANLHISDLSDANLSRSTLKNIRNWGKIVNIQLANIYGVKEAPEGFIEWAIEQGAVSIDDYEGWEVLLRKKEQEKTKEK